ncbi:uncharacterized protein LOC112455541 [Temnothorax curvispinosus]|uniref:Uncharacterized protein LOC112455541 n=1 Tax=Temnothorax curvispinosus TaxID=300111 RepID=A0A6J1PTX2_9HYME|nr:uncharacterized protein LOC112455541 [Temnothorax curvispinosus]
MTRNPRGAEGRRKPWRHRTTAEHHMGMHEMDQAGRGARGPDCLSIANGAQAAHVTGTPNVYRMDRSVFQVLQERSPACRDCRCDERPSSRDALFLVCHRRQKTPGCGAKTRETTLGTTSSETDKTRADRTSGFRRLEYPRGRARVCIPFLEFHTLQLEGKDRMSISRKQGLKF